MVFIRLLRPNYLKYKNSLKDRSITVRTLTEPNIQQLHYEIYKYKKIPPQKTLIIAQNI